MHPTRDPDSWPDTRKGEPVGGWRFLLLAPWLAAMIMIVVIAMTPPPHTGLIVATGLCMLVLLAGIVPLTFTSRE